MYKYRNKTTETFTPTSCTIISSGTITVFAQCTFKGGEAHSVNGTIACCLPEKRFDSHNLERHSMSSGLVIEADVADDEFNLSVFSSDSSRCIIGSVESHK